MFQFDKNLLYMYVQMSVGYFLIIDGRVSQFSNLKRIFFREK
jgi:hypothetical protein